MIFHSSPTLSTCDSLDGIDLDAFLDSQGALSHFPTPPLKSEIRVEAHELPGDLDPDDLSNDSLSDMDEEPMCTATQDPIAAAFATEAAIDFGQDHEGPQVIHNILIRADLPLELVAMAFNIIAGLRQKQLPVGTFNDCPNDLLVVAALSLAVSSNDDRPPRPFWWSTSVCAGRWTAPRIDKTVLKIFRLLDWELHAYSAPAAITQACQAFCGYDAASTHQIQIDSDMDYQMGVPGKYNLLTVLTDTTARWQHGQWTPEDSRPSSANGPVLAKMPLLPLL